MLTDENLTFPILEENITKIFSNIALALGIKNVIAK